MLVWNEFARKKLLGLSSAVLTFLPVASWFWTVLIWSVVCWSDRRFERTPCESDTANAI